MAVDLGKQIGPLPLGAWLVVVAGGLGIAYYTRKSGTDSESDGTIVEDTSTDPGVGTGAVGGWIPTTPGTVTPTPDTKPETNEEWGQAAINWLIGQNYSPLLADSTIRKYLASEQLSVAEYTLLALVLAKLGSPPDPPLSAGSPPVKTPIPGPPKSVPTPVKPKPKPPVKKPVSQTKRYRYYTVRKGDNLWNIAKKYYGTGARYGTIYNANRKGKKRADGKVGMISNPAKIYPGWVLLIP